MPAASEGCLKAGVVYNMFRGDADIPLDQDLGHCEFAGAQGACKLAQLVLRNSHPVEVSHVNMCQLDLEDPASFIIASVGEGQGGYSCSSGF